MEKFKLALVDESGEIASSQIEYIELSDFYDLIDPQTFDKLIRDYFKDKALFSVPSSSFVVSFVESRPLFDGSLPSEEFFVVRHYQNCTLIREECFPTHDLESPAAELPSPPSMSSDELEQLTYENSNS